MNCSQNDSIAFIFPCATQAMLRGQSRKLIMIIISRRIMQELALGIWEKNELHCCSSLQHLSPPLHYSHSVALSCGLS